MVVTQYGTCAETQSSLWNIGLADCVNRTCCHVQDNVTERPERFFVAEIIQEKIFQQYHEEVPYSSAVRCSSHPEEHTLLQRR